MNKSFGGSVGIRQYLILSLRNAHSSCGTQLEIHHLIRLKNGREDHVGKNENDEKYVINILTERAETNLKCGTLFDDPSYSKEIHIREQQE